MTADWPLFPTLNSQYLDHDTQLLPDGPTPLSLAEGNANMFVVSPGTGNTNDMSTSMARMRGMHISDDGNR